MSISDMENMEILLDETADAFSELMGSLFDEDPTLFETRFSDGTVLVHSTKATWQTQVDAASDEFREELNRLVAKFEERLHNGEFAND